MPVRVLTALGHIENMTEKLAAQLGKKCVLGLKVRIKGCPANVRDIDDFADRDLVVMLLREQL